MDISQADGGEQRELPDVVGQRFEVVDLLGEGGFGSTYRALDRATGSEVAVKVLRMDRLDDWKALELFEREARVLETLDHPRIPDYVDYITDEERGRAYLAQELAPGRSIGDILADGRRFEEAEALGVARQVLEVLHYLESLSPQVVHRDLKPDNLLLDEDSVYVVDFGAVREVVRQTGGGSTVAGTFGYMAPEQLQGRASPASDLFGLGMTLIHMLSGMAPELMEQRRMRPDYRPLVDISPAFAHVIDAMTEVVVDDRIDSARRCLELLQRVEGADRVRMVPDEGGDDIKARLARREAQKQQARDAKELQRLKAQQEISERREEAGNFIEIEARGPSSWVVEFDPPRRRIVDKYGMSSMIITVLVSGIALIVGLLMIVLPFVFNAHLAVIINSVIWGIVIAAVGAAFSWVVPGRLIQQGGRLEIQDDAFSIVAPLRMGREMIGRIEDLELRIEQPAKSEVYGTASFSCDGTSLQMQMLTPQELERLERFGKRITMTVVAGDTSG